MLYTTRRSKISTSTNYFDLQQQQQQLPEEDDDEESALYNNMKRKLKVYGTAEIVASSSSSTTSSTPSPPLLPTMQTSGRCSRSEKRKNAFFLNDFVLPALDPKAQEVTAATTSIPSFSSSFSLLNTKENNNNPTWFIRRKPVQVNLSTIRSNYKISRKRARDDDPKVYGFIDDIKQYFQYDAYASMIKSILWANQTIVLFVNLDLIVDLLLCCAYVREIIQGYDISLSPYWLFKNRSIYTFQEKQQYGLWSRFKEFSMLYTL
ncbi:hypothetical protein BDC45DRAFT_510713 [Circinella umbellata]|nr:hypothetical protein BDC45DRAFT_510713 [Circinella umbellata]